MRITWFGGTTMRLHIGGAMLVIDAHAAPAGLDRTELLSGADRVLGRDDALPQAEARSWQPRRVAPLLEATEPAEVMVHRLAPEALLIEAAGEPPLVVAWGAVPEAGRWGRDAVVLVAGADLPATALSAVEAVGPRLLAIAGSEAEVEATIGAVRDRLDGTGLMALEPALALEV